MSTLLSIQERTVKPSQMPQMQKNGKMYSSLFSLCLLVWVFLALLDVNYLCKYLSSSSAGCSSERWQDSILAIDFTKLITTTSPVNSQHLSSCFSCQQHWPRTDGLFLYHLQLTDSVRLTCCVDLFGHRKLLDHWSLNGWDPSSSFWGRALEKQQKKASSHFLFLFEMLWPATTIDVKSAHHPSSELQSDPINSQSCDDQTLPASCHWLCIRYFGLFPGARKPSRLYTDPETQDVIMQSVS